MYIEITPYINLFVSILLIAYSIRLIWKGWLAIRKNKKIDNLSDKLGILLVRFFQGPKEAVRLQEEMLTTNRIKRTGISAIFGGSLLLIAGLLYFFEIVKQF